jgi:hypothetical protein
MKRLVLLSVLVVSLAGAGDAAAVVVLIKPDGPDPRTARVAPFGTVRWENLTTTAQRVESIGEPDFDPVSVAARGAGERRFNRVGRYRYRLSATGHEGLVIGGAAVRRPRPRGRGCSRREVYVYNVTTRASKSASEEWLPRYELDGKFSFGYRYTVRYPRVAVVAAHDCLGGIRFRARQLGTGALTSYDWSDQVVSRTPENGTALPCAFAEESHGLGARIKVDGDLDRRGGWALSVESRLTRSQNDALGELLVASREAVCDRGDLSNASVFDDLPGHGAVPIFADGYRIGPLRLDSPLLDLVGQFGWSGRWRPPQAVRALARGRSVTVNSGTKRYQGTSIQTIAEARASMKVTFTRRR